MASPVATRPCTSLDVAARMGESIDALWSATRRIGRSGYSQFVVKLGSKRRVISAPREWLKSLQSRLYERVLLEFPVSDAVYSQRGRNVVLNAQQHLARTHMVALDIKDCFPSTKRTQVSAALRRAGLDEEAATLITRLTTAKGVLPQGPPTSPYILNLVMAPIDDALSSLAEKFSATYTRYMDDLCFSANQPLADIVGPAAEILATGGYRINEAKKRVWGPNDPHTVTKIIVASSLQPNEEYLHDLTQELETYDPRAGALNKNQLLGKIAWVMQLNAELGVRLMRRFKEVE